MAGRLAGKVAVVTGAAPRGEGVGNGMATAIMFAREGAKVVLVNRSAERAEALAKQIVGEGGEAAIFAGDVTQPETASEMADFAVDRYGRLDILHNNVGVGGPGTPETVSMEDWNRVLQTNLTSSMVCCKYAIPKMLAGGGGSIIMVSSIAGAVGLSGSAGAVAYATAKAGLHGMTMS
ncbi:MAG: SDR family NAD(P)-dependent oxidoreductase, partial [Reyranellaceae bacterium]